MRVKYPMREALENPDAFGKVMAGSSRYGWRVILIAAAGEALNDDERAEFKRLTGRDHEPGRMCRELIAAVGRRGGKTQAATVFAAWIAIYVDHRDVLAPGETGVVLVISRDQRAAKIVLDYFEGMLRSVDPRRSPLPGMIANRTQESILLTNGIEVAVRPCNRVSVRGPTYVAAICDEIAFWFTEVNAANPDVEILAALRPGLLTTRGPLLMASSAYAQRGALYDSFKKYYGPNGPPDILVAYATSRDLNPSLPQEEIDRELEKDPTRNRAEYLSEWRADVEGFIPRSVVEACVADCHELPPSPGNCYRLLCRRGVRRARTATASPSRSVTSSATASSPMPSERCARHSRRPRSSTPCCCRCARPTTSAASAGDNYAGEYPKELVRAVGISYEQAARTQVRALCRTRSCRCSTRARSTCRTMSVRSTRFALLNARCSDQAATRSRIPPTATTTWPMPSLAPPTSPTARRFSTPLMPGSMASAFGEMPGFRGLSRSRLAPVWLLLLGWRGLPSFGFAALKSSPDRGWPDFDGAA